jgi:hypothetical protein
MVLSCVVRILWHGGHRDRVACAREVFAIAASARTPNLRPQSRFSVEGSAVCVGRTWSVVLLDKASESGEVAQLAQAIGAFVGPAVVERGSI